MKPSTDMICAVFLGVALLASIFEGMNEISAPIVTGLMGYMGRDLMLTYQSGADKKGPDPK